MLLYYIIVVCLAVALVLIAKGRKFIAATVITFFVLQLAGAGYACCRGYEVTQWVFFKFDALGLTYTTLMAFMGLLTAWRSVKYLNCESVRHYKIYFCSLILLGASLIGVYISSNIAVTWIFLEATTLATAGLTYHRRTARALEATWKYIFVSSVGIAVAYLGVLLLAAASPDTLSYEGLKAVVASAEVNEIYLKLAFLFILVGYSTKLEIFPLFTVGIDANHSAPTPASAFISSSLVGGGFVALFRVYQVAMESPVANWVSNLLMLVGIFSLLASAVYMGRTSNYKRLLAYSTVENSGITMLGLALGGVGVYAALIHSLAHFVIKGVVYLQMSVVGRLYDSYKVGRIVGYVGVDRVGAVVIMLCAVAMVAAPPSLLFLSEYLIFSEVISTPRWWLIIPIVVPLLACAYWTLTKLLMILFGASKRNFVIAKRKPTLFSLILVLIMLGLFSLTIVYFDEFDKLLFLIRNA